MTQTKDELIKARECLEELVGWAHEGQMFASRVHECEDLISKALDAQIKACDVPKIEGLGEAIIIQETTGATKEAEYNFLSRYKRTFESVIDEAARAYHKQMEQKQ